MVAGSLISVSLLFGSLNLTSDSVDYRTEVRSIWNSKCSDVIPQNDSTLLIASFDGVLRSLNNKTGETKNIWETNHAIEKIAIRDSIAVVLGARNLYIILMTGETVYHAFDERFLLGHLILSDNEVIVYTPDNVYVYDRRVNEGHHMKQLGVLSRLLYLNHQYILAFEDGYAEIRESLNEVMSKRVKLHHTDLNFIDVFDEGFISCSSDSFKIWDREFQPVRSEPLNTSKNVIKSDGALVWSNYGDEFYRYAIRTGVLTIFYDSIAQNQVSGYEADEGAILYYDLIEERIDTLIRSEIQAEALTLSDNHDSLLLATRDGRLCYTPLDSIHFTCSIRDKYYAQPLFLTWSNNLVMIGALKFFKIKPLSADRNICEQAYGLVAFNGAYFLKEAKYAVVTVSGDRFSYVQILRLSDSLNKQKRSDRKGEIKPISEDFCRDTMPILASAFISESSVLAFSRGNELIFFDCVRKLVTKTIWVDRPVTCIYLLESKNQLIIGDQEGFIRIYSLWEARWLSEYENYSSKALVSIVSTRFGDTLFLSSPSEIIVVCQGGLQHRYIYSGGLTNLVYSPASQRLIYSTTRTPRKNYFEWEKDFQNSDSITDTALVAGIIQVIPSRDGYVLLTASGLFYYQLRNTP